MSRFIPGTTPLVFPQNTIVAHQSPTWAMYTNRVLNTTWIGYAVPNGTRLIQLPGIRSKLGKDFAGIRAYVKQSQATACGACGE